MDSLIETIRESLGQYTPGNWLLYRGSIDCIHGEFLADFCLLEADGCHLPKHIPRLLGDAKTHTEENKASLREVRSTYATKLDIIFYNL